MAEAVLQEQEELLLHEPLHHHPATDRGQAFLHTHRASEPELTHLLNSSSGLVWACEWGGEEGSCSGFRLLEKACRCLTSRRTTRTCSSVGAKGSWKDSGSQRAAQNWAGQSVSSQSERSHNQRVPRSTANGKLTEAKLGYKAVYLETDHRPVEAGPRYSDPILAKP